MYARDLYSRRKGAGITRQRDLLKHLPPLPNGSKVTVDFYGRIERGEVSIEPEVYNTIIATIDAIAAKRASA